MGDNELGNRRAGLPWRHRNVNTRSLPPLFGYQTTKPRSPGPPLACFGAGKSTPGTPLAWFGAGKPTSGTALAWFGGEESIAGMPLAWFRWEKVDGWDRLGVFETSFISLAAACSRSRLRSGRWVLSLMRARQCRRAALSTVEGVTLPRGSVGRGDSHHAVRIGREMADLHRIPSLLVGQMRRASSLVAPRAARISAISIGL
jgi:hypothetical protein